MKPPVSHALWDICIRRPVFTVVLVTIPIVLGLNAMSGLGIELFPNVDVPVVTITTALRGASAEEVESAVTKPLEEIVNTVSGLDELMSTSSEGLSVIMASFKIDKNGDVAAQEVDAKIRTILARLPVGVEPPVIDKLDMGSIPVVSLAVSGPRDPREITEIARKRLKEQLESLSGVGSVTLVGGRMRAVNVIVDPVRMQKYPGLTIEDVRQTLLRDNQEYPGGRVDQTTSERVLRTMGRVRKPEELLGLIVGNFGGQPVRIEDVGRVEDSCEEPRSAALLWTRGDPAHDKAPPMSAVGLIVQKRTGKNTVHVAAAVKKRLAELQAALPTDISVEIVRDQSRFTETSISHVRVHLVLAGVLVSLSILLFLRDWRTTLIASLAIPTSLVGAFAFMQYMGFTINDFTMLGLILAVGIVVDDAVVVHENIFRHMEEFGKSAKEAASSATAEIALAVLATTLSLVVIFLPIALMGGLVGRFLSCFGWVVAFCVMMSMAVSFTLTPMLCARFLKLEAGHGSKSGVVWRAVEGGYMTVLSWSLKHRWLVVLVALGVLFSTPVLAGIVGKDFVAKEDQSQFEVSVTLPEGYSLARTRATLEDFELRLRDLPGVWQTYTMIGDLTGRSGKGQGSVNIASVYCRLIDRSERSYPMFAVMKQARGLLANYPEMRGSVQMIADIPQPGGRQVDINLSITGPDIEKLSDYARKVMERMREIGQYSDLDTSLALRKPEIRILPNRERLSDAGASQAAVAAAANVLVGGEPIGKYREADEQYDVWLRAESTDRADRDAIGRMTVPATKTPAKVVRLDAVCDLEEALGPASIGRFARQRQVLVYASLQGKDLSAAVEELSAEMKKLDLGPEYRFEFLGDAKLQSESNSSFLVGFGLAFLFMYMILAAQFESFIHPVSILAGLPLTIPFAILALILMRTNLDLFGMLGLFMLFGISKKNGILQIDYTNHLRDSGLPKTQAILEANRARLRPILMTTVMLVAAMIPMAADNGPGSATRASMAKVILGGQTLSLLLTLLVTPVAYSLFDGFGEWWRARFRKRRQPIVVHEPMRRSEPALTTSS